MVFWLLQQAHTYISTKLRYFLMSSQDAGFLYNVNGDWGEFVLEYTPITHDWVEDSVIKEIIDPKNDAFVEKVEFCKCRAFPAEHEFLIISLKESNPKDSSQPRKSVVLIERNNIGRKDNTGAKTPNDTHDTAVNGRIDVREGPSNVSGPESTVQELPPSNPQNDRSLSDTDKDHGSYSGSRLLSGISSSSSFPKRKSGDYMVFPRNGRTTFISPREGPYDVGRTLTLPAKKFTLLQLTTLFCAVHNKRPDYRLPDFNCYWMSGAVYNSIHYLVEGCTEDTKPKIRIGSAAKVFPTLPGDVTLEEFVGEYKTQWKTTQESIAAVRELAEQPMRDARAAQKKAENDRLESERAQKKAENDRLESERGRLQAEEKIKRLEAELERLREQSEGSQSTATKQRPS